MVGCNQHLPSAFLLSPHHAMDQLLEDLFAYHALLSQVPVNSVTMTNHIFSISANKSLLLSVSIPSTSPLSHPESSSHQHAFCKIHRRLILHTFKPFETKHHSISMLGNSGLLTVCECYKDSSLSLQS
jgi:hypothetical protein